MPKNQNKHERFVRMAEARTNKALKMIQLIGKMSDYQVYEYSRDDVQKIITVLQGAVRDCEVSLISGTSIHFSLK